MLFNAFKGQNKYKLCLKIHYPMIYVTKSVQIPAARTPGRINYTSHNAYFFRVLGVKLALCHTSGVQNFQVAAKCLDIDTGPCMSPLYVKQINLLKPTGHVMHQQFNIQQLYVLSTLYLCVLYLSENRQRLVPLTA